MGIHGLFPFLQKHCPQVIHQVTDLSQFKDKTFAIDVAVLMYAASYGYRNNSLRNNANLPDTVTEDTSYLTYFTDHAAKLDRLGIKYIYVFDGAAPESKQQELKRRKQT
jgi:5'-3' exonuclease